MLVKNIKVELGGKEILSNVSFEARRGINVILGPNGSGKTTLLRVLIGMIKPKEGEVILDRGERLSYVPSEFFPATMRVSDVLLAGNKRGKIEDYIEHTKTLGIYSLLDRDFFTLSSGEKRLVLISKALAEGNVVLMDEPLSNLDLSNKYKTLRLISEIKDEKTFLITSHELEVLDYADQVIVMKRGRVAYVGEPKELSEEVLSDVYNVKVKKYYLENRTFFKVED